MTELSARMTTHPLEGAWRPLKAELDGEAAPDMALAQLELVLRAGHYQVVFGGEVSDRGRYAFSAAATTEAAGLSPATTLVLFGEVGANAGRTIPAIFQLAGDRLRICFGLGGALPTSFTTTAGSARYLVTYRRAIPG